MVRCFFCCLGMLLFAAWEGNALGQANSGLIPPPLMARFGLVRAWHAQVELDSAVTRVTHVTQHVSATRGVTIIDIVAADNERQRITTITNLQLDAFGKPLGHEGAKIAAERRIAELQEIGVAAKALTQVVPEITLYVSTGNGLLHAINGETGASRWAIQVGNSDFPSFAAAANDEFVAAINGIHLYVYHAADGRLAFTRRLIHSPGAGPALTQSYVHVPLAPGLLESYHLLDPKVPDRIYQSFGRAVLQPVVSPASVIWATDRGFMYVGNADQPGVRYRLETQAEISARPAWLAPNRVVVASRDGDVYCTDEFTGALIWRFSTGEAIGSSPVAVGDDVFVITDNYTMFRLSGQSGGYGPSSVWSTLNIRKFLAASKNRLYCLDYTGRVVVLDRATGGRVATLPVGFLEIDVLNYQTDRLFFVTRSGLLQSFREVGNEYPIIHNGPGMEAPTTPPVTQEGEADPKAKPAPEAPAGGDPFGGAADPFGGAADPFGGGGGAPGEAPKKEPEGDDPFGAAADPFATP